MNVTLKVWRQKGPNQPGGFVEYKAEGIIGDMSFLEMLDTVNEGLVAKGEPPIAFDNDCREGICGMCGLVINGVPHGPSKGTTTCELYMRHFHDGDTIVIEPWRSVAFPVMKDLIVDRSAFDRIVQAGGYISCKTGSAIEANTIPVPKPIADRSMDAATCIGCGACVAACPNGSAMLFTSAKIGHLNLLPQGKPERFNRAVHMIEAMEAEKFGGCTNHGECEAACPKSISIDFIAFVNREYMGAYWTADFE
ncbi:MAG: succinate dehydrogenase/fumarate reductase iron-sulfur subunit [Chlorobi bacterium]|nr:succinate dehydrogenase/fumarate reductase iron-sulfur subunit [Chlorobiota bacterium]